MYLWELVFQYIPIAATFQPAPVPTPCKIGDAGSTSIESPRLVTTTSSGRLVTGTSSGQSGEIAFTGLEGAAPKQCIPERREFQHTLDIPIQPLSGEIHLAEQLVFHLSLITEHL